MQQPILLVLVVVVVGVANLADNAAAAGWLPPSPHYSSSSVVVGQLRHQELLTRRNPRKTRRRHRPPVVVGLQQQELQGCHHRWQPEAFGTTVRRAATVASSSLDHSSGGEGAVATTSNTTTSSSTTAALLWDEIRARFQGDFDNYAQVLDDRRDGKLPREGGGHEHIHCTLVPLSESTRLAAFYFDGTPQAIFRFRYYELVPRHLDDDGAVVDTVLYTLHPALEQLLRTQAATPSVWPLVFEGFHATSRDGGGDNNNNNINDHDDTRVRLLPNCDVRWSWRRDPVLHEYAAREEEERKDRGAAGIHAVMVHGEATVESQVAPGQYIRILDQLSLYPNVLYIHDRGFNVETGDFIYGNRHNVPYRLERVAEFRPDGGGGGGREVVSNRLRWTLGPDYRTDSEFRDKIAAMGGPSNPKAR